MDAANGVGSRQWNYLLAQHAAHLHSEDKGLFLRHGAVKVSCSAYGYGVGIL